MDRWRAFSSALSPVWLSRFLARSPCLLFSRFVGISLARSPYGSRSLARWIHSFALSPARSISRFFALSLSYSFALSFFSRSPCLARLLARFLALSLSCFSLVLSVPPLSLSRVCCSLPDSCALSLSGLNARSLSRFRNDARTALRRPLSKSALSRNDL